MKRVFFSVLPMVLLIIAINIVFFIESVFIDQIMDLFNLDDTSSINSFNIFFVYFLGLSTVFILSKYTMEMNERIFRMFTFFLNLFGVIVIISVVIRSGFLEWK